MDGHEQEQHINASHMKLGAVTAATALSADLLLHGGIPGLLIGGVVTAFVAKEGPGIYRELSRYVELPSLPSRQRAPDEITVMDRLLGKHHQGRAKQQEDDEDTLPDPPLEKTVLLPVETPAVSAIFPAYPSQETLRLGTVVNTGQRFDPNLNQLLGAGVILAGSQGSGKSVAVAVLAEQIGEREMSEVLFDMKREYASILSVVANGIIAGHPDAEQEFHGAQFYPLTEENATQFAAAVMEEGYQAVVDIPSFLECSGNDWNMVARIITAVLNGLMRWSIEQKRAEDRLPCLVGFDEAHIFFPQVAEMKSLFDQMVLNALNATAFSMVNMGRSYGYTMLFATQRIANIAKWTIGNCQIKVIMKHSVDVDLERCSKEIGKDGQGKWYATEQDVRNLPAKKGYAYVLGFTNDPYLIQFDMRRSYHPSNTPQIDRVQQRKERKVQTQKGPAQREVTIDDILAAIGKLPDVDPDDSRYTDPEQPRLRLVGNSHGNNGQETISDTHAQHWFREHSLRPGTGVFPSMPDMPMTEPVEPVPDALPETGNGPELGKDDYKFSPEQEAEFIRRFRKTLNIQDTLAQMPNSRGGIGISKRYYRHAKWLVEQRLMA